jgi:hypothetical protein
MVTECGRRRKVRLAAAWRVRTRAEVYRIQREPAVSQTMVLEEKAAGGRYWQRVECCVATGKGVREMESRRTGLVVGKREGIEGEMRFLEQCLIKNA